MLDPESINPVEGAATVLATAFIYGVAWVPFVGIVILMRKKLNIVFSLVASIPLLIMGIMVAMVLAIG